MLDYLARNWWVLMIRGICAILFGVLAFIWPALTLYVLMILFGAYALVDGVTTLVLSFAGRGEGQSWGSMLIVGLLGIAAGIITFLMPGLTAVMLLFIIAGWSIVRGIFEIIAAIRLRKAIEHEWLLGVAGAISIVFGLVLLARPLVGALALVWLIASYSIVFGILGIALSLRLREVRKRISPTAGMPRTA